MRTIACFCAAVTLLSLYSCGQGTVEVNDQNFEPKIVLEAYIYPGLPVQNIRITRNIPLNTQIQRDALIIDDAAVLLTDLAAERDYDLVFDDNSQAWRYPGTDLQIRNGQSYKLSVSARIDGRDLQASSVTRVPQAGFRIIQEESTDSIGYHEFGPGLRLLKPTITFRRSPGTDFYAFSIVAEEADLKTFIYPPRNPYVFPDWDEKDVEENFYDLIYSSDEIFNASREAGTMSRQLEWFHVMFFGRYRVIAYAGDQNMKDFYLSYRNVYEMDGNLHEPVFHIAGDGIGVFGSAITDTTWFYVRSLTSQ